MKMSLFTDKRAVSEMVSYALLVIIAVGVSVLVYNYLEVLSPKDKPVCPEDVSLNIEDYSCTLTAQGGSQRVRLDVNITNRGLHTVDAYYLRIGPPGRNVRELINSEENNEDLYIGYVSGSQAGLIPGMSMSKSFNFISSQVVSGDNFLELEPAIQVSDTLALCENAIAVQQIRCN